ncbi:hypothetical protein G3485_09825 [Shewanella baltica]|uniref:hypothetical protein n=1 Tax=Shewanella baltica TaxID=62322 RepID=UPI00217ECB31|nr:hypothetical protein [Shewanella baltica]MCS6127291.1 hypothetical protein [Shewanella baltica]MCS6139364.1 hypothetical protein [Shewanella baltica]MCS6145555.1 hypothetical protein [Shewanella baltica]MCS6170034.1 hypothetical protein [Shewanella baltica]MCS6187309.1 hypothetical protein [Shewanella baltica]
MKLALCSPIGLFQGASVLLLCSLIGSEPVQATLAMPRSESGAAHTHVLPVFGQQLGFNLPAGWKQAYHEEQAGMFMAEYVPEQEALAQWSALFCVQGFKDMAESISPERFLDAMAQTYKSTCDGEVVYQKLGDTEVDGHAGFHAILGCTAMPNLHGVTPQNPKAYASTPQGEIGYYTVVSGNKDLYLLHKSMRGAVFSADKPPLQADNSQDFISTLVPFSLK